jgi:hypothetical protein
MNCPKCNQELTKVNVYSQCVQTGTVDPDGKITNYGALEILETLAIECPKCSTNITTLIEEN